MGNHVFLVDAFTDSPFAGNPAGVCILSGDETGTWMRAVAAEINASETAFISLARKPYLIRYFTPQVEVPLCGHATLSTAHVLWDIGAIEETQPIPMLTSAGPVSAQLEQGWVRLDFPSHQSLPIQATHDWVAMLGTEPRMVSYHPQTGHLLDFGGAAQVRDMQPDFGSMLNAGLGYVIVTAPSDDDPAFDFVSRFFAPGVGINEDPVTGVAHTSLGPLWCARTSKDEVIGHQVSRRGGIVRVRSRGERVDILGQAVTVIRGELA